MGPALCLSSAACFGAMAIFGKLAYAAGVPSGTLLLVRFGLAAALLALLLMLRPGLRRDPMSPGPTTGAVGTTPMLLVTALALGAVGYALQASLYFSALEFMDASILSLVFYAYPLLVTLTAVLLGRDRLTPGRCVASVAASGGTSLVLLGTGGMDLHPFGAVLAIGAAVTYTGYILIADSVVRRLPPVKLAALVMAGAAFTMAVRSLVTGGADLGFGWRGWFWLVCIAAVSTVLAMLTFFAGLRRTGPSTAAILSTFEPVVTASLAALTLGEVLTPLQVAGGLLVVASVAALQLRGGTRVPPRRNAGRTTAGDPQQRVTVK
ncbi:DMT family transporter [Actinoplanes utahensis]|uniref:DMT family transporter n=1 Tax=Actinoplanes utahensis TaxID=1869 RepID=UPI00068A2ACB|nr:DMT family transporter [Actinoplanes utahensis]